MKGQRLVLTLISLLLIAGCAGSKTKVVDKKGMNLKVTEIPSAHSPLIAFRILFKSGTINEPKGKEGVAAVTASVMAQGGTGEMSYNDVVQALYPMAASIGQQINKEVTVFTGNVHADHLEEFYDIFSNLILNPRWDESDFKRIVDEHSNQIKNSLRSNDDENLGKAALNLFMYEGHPYSGIGAGTVKSLAALTIEDLKAFAAANYTQDNLVIGIAGGYPDGFSDRMRADFSVLAKEAPAVVELPEPKPINGIEVMIVKKDNDGAAISIGAPIDVTRSDKDFYALMVANSYLGEHRTFNGALMRHMREDRGLNYGDYAYIENFIQDGGSTFPVPNVPRRQQFFSIWIRPVSHANALFSLKQAIRELDMLVTDGISEEDFETTRKYLLNYSKLWVQTASRRLGYLMDSDWYGTGYFIDKIAEELPKLTREDVNAAIKKYLQSENLKVAIITEEAEKVRDMLLSGEKTPIVYQAGSVSQELLDEDKLIESYDLNINEEALKIVDAGELFEG